MKASRKQDSILHEIVFKQKQDIAPRYTTDFNDTALFMEMLLLEENVLEMTIGFDESVKKWYAQVFFETDFEEIQIKKLETTKELAISSVALAYFGGKSGSKNQVQGSGGSKPK